MKASLGADHSVIVTDTGKVFVFGSNSHGQLGLSEVSMITNLKLVSPLVGPVSFKLDSIKEISMENSSVMKRPDEITSLREYTTELESKLRAYETYRDTLMSETMKFLSKTELLVEEYQKDHFSFGSRSQLMLAIDKVAQTDLGFP